MKKVMTFGTFDHFHAGHEYYLKQAKALGDMLIVIVARDKTVKRIKGSAPDYNEKERLKTVKACKIAEKVTLGEIEDKYEVIKRFKPEIIALGYDQFTFTYRLGKFLIDNKINAKIIRLKPYKPTVYKTTILKNEISTCGAAQRI